MVPHLPTAALLVCQFRKIDLNFIHSKSRIIGESALGLLRGFVHFVPFAHEQIAERLCASKNTTFVNTAEATKQNPRHVYANTVELLEHQELMLFLRQVFRQFSSKLDCFVKFIDSDSNYSE